MKPTRHITIFLAAAALLASQCALAQQINTEVEMRYEETPRLTELNKLSLTPKLSLPPVQKVNLPFSTGNPSVTLPGTISTLDPAGYADTIYAAPWRGYAALGFMPRFNLGASAGYKILNTDKTRLNAYLQYDGTAYRGNRMLFSELNDAAATAGRIIRRNTATIGANLHQAAGKESFIDLGFDYSFTRMNNLAPSGWVHQNVNRFNISGLWSASNKKMSYGLGAGFNRFAPTNSWGYTCVEPAVDAAPETHPAVATRESRVNLSGFFNYTLSQTSSAGINIRFTNQQFNHNGLVLPLGEGLTEHLQHTSQSTLRLTPTYRLLTGKFDLSLGANLDFSFNQGATFHIAPAAQATWKPGNFVKVFLKASGGQHINTLSSLFNRNPYAVPFGAWRNSQVAVDAEAGITFGTWKGFYAEASFTFARANNWLMPTIAGNGIASTFEGVDMSGYRLHIGAGYNYRNIAELHASFDMAPQKFNRGYYLWTDRAKRVITLDLTVRPIKQLELNAAWELRSNRLLTGSEISNSGWDLSSISNLKAGATYHLSDQWSVFLTGENLLNHQYYLVGGVSGQGRTGLLGATYKF